MVVPSRWMHFVMAVGSFLFFLVFVFLFVFSLILMLSVTPLYFLLLQKGNISEVVTANSDLFLSVISANLSKLADDIHSLYGSFTYGLPEAQQKVDLYVGEGYYKNTCKHY